MAHDSLRREDSHRKPAVRRCAIFVLLTFAFASFASLAVPSVAIAQQYQADDVDEAAGKLKLTAEQAVKNPGRFAADRARFNEFFEKYYFPAMTRFSPDELGQLGRLRDDLFNRFLWASTDENLQNELTKMAIEKLKPIERNTVKGKNYHPAVRYNAVLIIGMLDATYPRPGVAAVPLKEAAVELTVIVNAAAEGKRVPPFLVVGALVGLQRHAQYADKLDRDTLEKLSAAVLKLAVKDDPLAEADAKVTDWVRMQAATVLAKLGNPGAGGEVVAALTKMIAGENKPKMTLDGRTQVAALLKQLKFENAKFDGKATTDALLELALTVADDEAKEAQKFEDAQVQGGGYGGGYGGGGGNKGRMKFDLETQELSFDTSILLTRLTDLQTALSAFKSSAPADKQPVIEAVLAAIAPAIEAAGSNDITDLQVASTVGQMATQIRAAVKPGTSAPTEADDAALF